MILSAPLAFLALSLLIFAANPVLAQQAVNGQVFTNGLSIVDAPAIGSTQHSGSNLNIAIDVSGDGKLPTAAAFPGSGLATGFDSLEIYLVSAQTSLNVTVANASALLNQEPGSTVKHLNWPIASCLEPGAYNLTIYEGFHVNGKTYFAITPIPITIENSIAPTGFCPLDLNPLQRQPQASSPPPQNPFLASTSINTAGTRSAAATPTVTEVYTFTIGPSGVQWPFNATMNPGTVTETVSGQTVTVTKEEPISQTVTVVFMSIGTVTSTAPGQTVLVTATVTSFSTTTALMEPSTPSASASGQLVGFFPVSGAPSLNCWTTAWTISAVASLGWLLAAV